MPIANDRLKIKLKNNYFDKKKHFALLADLMTELAGVVP